MSKKILILILTIFLVGNTVFSGFSLAKESKLQIYFFYSEICPHCLAEEKFLDEIEKNYPEVEINRYLAYDPANQEFLRELAKKYNAEKYIGLVPLTFVGKDFFLGFDNSQGIGKDIEDSIQKQLAEIKGEPIQPDKKINLPLLGQVDVSKYSLPVLTILLGFLDGFNICSFGALVLILGLVLVFRRRFKIIIFGSAFILTTALVYGLLMLLWYRIFSLLSPYQKLMQFLVGLIAIGGGVYFLKEYLRFRKVGPVCEVENVGIISKLTSQIKETFKNPRNILSVIGAILIFAAILTIVEFPCSAAVPVVYTSILAHSNLLPIQNFLYITLFLIFYMIDEIIVFLVAVFTMTVWLASKKFITFFTLIEGIILFLLGLYYIFGLRF